MSEVFGRRLMFILTYIPFTAFNAAVCGSKHINIMLVLRFFAGTFGSSTMTNSGGIIADMFEAHERGLAMGIFSAVSLTSLSFLKGTANKQTPFLGPAIGPVVSFEVSCYSSLTFQAGGFLSQASSWEWVAAVIALFAGALTLIESILLPETYPPVLLRARAKKLSKITGKVYRYEKDVAKPLDTKALFLNQLKVPYILLFTEPIVAITAL
jgi:MFS family permease